MDIGKTLRLAHAIKASVDSFPADVEAPFSGEGLSDAYKRFREQARSLAPSEDHEEFDALFPEWREVRPMHHNKLFEWTEYSNTARERLSRLGGWLDGYVAEAQMRANAEAYAVAQVKQERGVGFQP